MATFTRRGFTTSLLAAPLLAAGLAEVLPGSRQTR
jgi:hypothetical protein